MFRVFFILVGILLLLYGLYAGYFYRVQRHAIFPRYMLPPSTQTIADYPGWQQRWITIRAPDSSDNNSSDTTAVARVESWFLPPPSTQADAPVILMTHGNGDLMEMWPGRVHALARAGWGVLLIEYPGYGRSTGEPSEATIAGTLTDAYDWVITQPGVDAERIILFGYSVGGGAIGTLAAQRPSAALVLMSTFTSVRAMAARYYLPGILVSDPFDTLAVVQRYAHPILLIHGSQDTTIPAANSVALHNAAPNSKLLLLPCGHANCVDDWDDFWPLVLDFLIEHGVLQ